jgi:drug/metabolite transporter (DMT)-like permease
VTEGQGKSNVQGALYALAAMFIYATHDVFIKFLGAHYAPFQTLFFAVLFSFPMVTFVLMQDTTVANLRPKHPWWVLIRTLSSTLVGFSAFYAFSNLPLAETYSILFITPLLITVLSIPILGETVRLRRWAAVIVGLIGVIIVLQPGQSDLGLGHLAALTAATFSSLANVIVRKIGQDERSAVLMLYPMVSNFLVMGAILGFAHSIYVPMPIEHIGAFAAMALLGTVAGLLFIASYKRAEAAVVAPMQYSQILWATLYGYLFFGESVESNVVVGAGIIILSGLYIVFRESRSKNSANTPVLSSMDLARDKGTRPNAGVWAKLRTRGAAAK